ncbi:transcription regulator [Lactococcus lactis subsp. lactis]|nr:helix-turn-helix transcriptional regulator [Lactococcus lactis]KAA8700297.1 helix-turn-helix transcriptional regulator [Lactococcus lactis subsp. hordniae]KSU14023.1 transcription regulator [Lactococcus lactis subsp. lactis]MCT3135720.1 XRE family transcriptional regulator [Lactococcus lactis]
MARESLFYHRLRKQIESKNKNFNQIEKELGYPRNSLNNYKTGVEPSGLRLVELSEYFEVSPSYLIGKREAVESEISEKNFHSLNFEQKMELYEICQSWAATQISKSNETNNK